MWSNKPDLGLLKRVLQSIDRAISSENVCHKIVVMPLSSFSDESTKVFHDSNWTVVGSPLASISYQANLALAQVDTELFASFEQDVVLHPRWLSLIHHFTNPKVAVAEGIRLLSGSSIMEKWDRWLFDHDRYAPWTFSIDNNLYRTEIIRQLGGFPNDCPMSTDGLLREKVVQNGYQWITDDTVISEHYRKDFWSFMRGMMKHVIWAKYYWTPKMEITRHLKWVAVRRFTRGSTVLGALYSPISAAKIARDTKDIRLLAAYPLFRVVRSLMINLCLFTGNRQMKLVEL